MDDFTAIKYSLDQRDDIRDIPPSPVDDLPSSPSAEELDKLDGITSPTIGAHHTTPTAEKSSTFSRSNENISSSASRPKLTRELEPNRARADEISSASPTVPKLNAKFEDTLGIYTELRNWFILNRDLGPFLDSLSECNGLLVKDISNAINTDICEEDRSQKLHDLVYYLLGSYKSVSSLEQHEKTITEHVDNVLDACDVVNTMTLPTEDYLQLTVLFVCLLAGTTVEVTPRVIIDLLNQVGAMRWRFHDSNDEESMQAQEQILAQLLMILKLALYRGFGGAEDEKTLDRAIWQSYGLTPDNYDSANQKVSPMDYDAFLNTVSARFPYYPDPFTEEVSDKYSKFYSASSSGFSWKTEDAESGQISLAVGKKLQVDPPQLSQPLNVESFIPYVPQSIMEACDLYKASVRASPEFYQYWDEQDLQFKTSFGAPLGSDSEPPVNPLPEEHLPVVKKVDKVYEQTMGSAKSFIRVIVDFIARRSMSSPDGAVHAGLLVIRRLISWYKLSHILKKEYISALLFDCQFYLVMYNFVSANTSVIEYLLDVDDSDGFWDLTRQISEEGRSKSPEVYGIPQGTHHKLTPRTGCEVIVDEYSQTHLEIYLNFISISRAIVSYHPQRLIVVSELPTHSLKSFLSVYNEQLWKELLGFLKAQVPYNGKRWRFLNMEVISAIYLHCNSGLDDDWLSTLDVSGEAKLAHEKEQSLRKLIEFYNSRITT